jgi:hypothetical protein
MNPACRPIGSEWHSRVFGRNPRLTGSGEFASHQGCPMSTGDHFSLKFGRPTLQAEGRLPARNHGPMPASATRTISQRLEGPLGWNGRLAPPGPGTDVSTIQGWNL